MWSEIIIITVVTQRKLSTCIIYSSLNLQENFLLQNFYAQQLCDDDDDDELVRERIAVISPHKMINDSLTGRNFIAKEIAGKFFLNLS